MHSSYLRQALFLARRGKGFCAPNPAVGAVIVKNDQVVASGFHSHCGGPHAEVVALESVRQQDLSNATLYVTLEPCSHYGKTPPCTEAIRASGITQVVFSERDSNPMVSGKSQAILQAVGISCRQFTLAEITDFYRSYRHWVQTRLPHRTAKIAMSLDGKISRTTREPTQLTGVECARFTHHERAQADAILTTANTVNADDPLFNARLPQETIAKTVFVIDSQLSISATAQLFQSAGKLFILHNEKADPQKIRALEKNQAICVPIVSNDKLAEVFQFIGAMGCHDLWIESGATLLNALLRAKAVERLVIYIAPVILGNNAVAAFSQEDDLISIYKQARWQLAGSDVIADILLQGVN